MQTLRVRRRLGKLKDAWQTWLVKHQEHTIVMMPDKAKTLTHYECSCGMCFEDAADMAIHIGEHDLPLAA